MINYYYPNSPCWIDSSTVDNYKGGWIAERKKNGWRCLTIIDEKLTLWTRRHTILRDDLPQTRKLLSRLPQGTVIDGELVDKRTKDIKDHYYAFDILFNKGESVMHLPWEKRRAQLESLFQECGLTGEMEMSEPIQLGFSTLYKLAVESGDEGIVLKKINSKYIVDCRRCPKNPFWLKAKVAEKQFVNKRL